MGAPKLAPGNGLHRRREADGTWARTKASRWHRLRWWIGHHLTREDDGEWADQTGWGGRRARVERTGRRSGVSRDQLREDMRAGQHAQALRAEAATVGGREEKARWFGTGEFAGAGRNAGGGERRTTIADAERQREAHEAEEAERWSGRRRRSEAVFRLPWEG